MSTYRLEALATAFLIAGMGLAKALTIVVAALNEAIDAATTLPRVLPDATCPDLLPDWVDDGSANW